MTRTTPRPAAEWTGDTLPTARAQPLRIADTRARLTVPIKAHTPERDPEVARSRRIRESARGEACQVRIVGVCTHDNAHTIWSHARWGAQIGGAGRGGAIKAIDEAGAYACTACDAAYDQMQGAAHYTRDQLDLDWCMGHFRSLGMLKEKGLL